MLYVSIFVELLRSRPALTVGIAAGVQAAIWTLVPDWFYAGPPGDVPMVLAIGHEFQPDSYLGPPLAFWLAELVFDLSRHSLFAVYALSQACVATTYGAVFRLGRAIVGAPQAALAVLLMAGVSSFTVATPDFGPAILAMPLWALALLHYWQTVRERRWKYAIALAIEVGLILLTTSAGLLLIGLLVVFTGANKHTRARLRSPHLWPAGIVAAAMLVTHLSFLAKTADDFLPTLARLPAPQALVGSFGAGLRQLALILGAHAGLVVLAGIVSGFRWIKSDPAPVIVRPPVEPTARQFIYFFASVPALLATVVGAALGGPVPGAGIAPLIVLSGLAVVIAAGDAIVLRHQRLVVAIWFALLLLPPVLTVVAMWTLPWIGIDLAINQPAEPMARFFSEGFARRFGKPLPIVAGDPRTAALVALGAPSRPSLYLDATPARSPWVSMQDIMAKGAIVVWPTTDTAGTPPPALTAVFSDLVPEVPRTFERTVQGRLPLLRFGWAAVRPQAAPESPAAPAPR
jgi:hypothetical protein